MPCVTQVGLNSPVKFWTYRYALLCPIYEVLKCRHPGLLHAMQTLLWLIHIHIPHSWLERSWCYLKAVGLGWLAVTIRFGALEVTTALGSSLVFLFLFSALLGTSCHPAHCHAPPPAWQDETSQESWAILTFPSLSCRLTVTGAADLTQELKGSSSCGLDSHLTWAVLS